MTPDDITLIRRQFAVLKGMENEFGAAFYARLFYLAPQLRAMFPKELREQSKKLMTVLGFAVAALDRPDELAGPVRALGRGHARHGVTPEQFAPVGQALLDTLATALGVKFTPDARSAWTAAYAGLAGLMAEGLAEGREAAAAAAG